MRLLALTALLALSISPVSAQETAAPRDSAVRNEHRTWPDRADRPRASIGPVVGLNFAKFGGSDVSGVDTRTGFQAGIFAAFPIGKIASIRPSVAYSQQGTELDGGGGLRLKFKLDYIEIPLMLRLSPALQGSGNIRPYFEAGPALAIEASCKVKGEQGSQSVELSCDDDQLQLQRKKTAFGVHFGAGLEVSRFFFGARYQLGLSSIDDTGGDVKNRVIAIMAGYGFRLGH